MVKTIYIITSGFPGEEKFGIVSQIRRASISVSSNIAEGSTRWSRNDQARFYEIAYGSLMEVLNQLILSVDLEYLSEEKFESIKTEIEMVSRMLNALYQSTQKV